jgi:hypothetical protein
MLQAFVVHSNVLQDMKDAEHLLSVGAFPVMALDLGGFTQHIFSTGRQRPSGGSKQVTDQMRNGIG